MTGQICLHTVCVCARREAAAVFYLVWLVSCFMSHIALTTTLLEAKTIHFAVKFNNILYCILYIVYELSKTNKVKLRAYIICVAPETLYSYRAAPTIVKNQIVCQVTITEPEPD